MTSQEDSFSGFSHLLAVWFEISSGLISLDLTKDFAFTEVNWYCIVGSEQEKYFLPLNAWVVNLHILTGRQSVHYSQTFCLSYQLSCIVLFVVFISLLRPKIQLLISCQILTNAQAECMNIPQLEYSEYISPMWGRAVDAFVLVQKVIFVYLEFQSRVMQICPVFSWIVTCSFRAVGYWSTKAKSLLEQVSIEVGTKSISFFRISSRTNATVSIDAKYKPVYRWIIC